MTEQDVNRPDFNPGGEKDTPDTRDLQWNDIGAALPPYDWSNPYDIRVEVKKLISPTFTIPTKDQGESGSCGGQAFSDYDALLEAVATKSFEERSAKYVIAQTFILDGNGKMLGSRLRDNADICVKQGVARESLLPSYENGNTPSDAYMNRPQDITEVHREDAKKSKARSFAYVAPDIESYAQAIKANRGLVTLIGGQSNGTWWSPFPKPPTFRQWGHFMYWGNPVIINGKKGIWGHQSWGPLCGDSGWQWFGEDYFASGFVEAAVTMVMDDLIPVPPAYQFTRDLTVGSTGIDVKFLQVFLNNHGYPLASYGVGSPGHETSTFGPLTKQAVAWFQRDNGIKPSVGYFGPLTRAKVNSMQ